MTVRRSVLLAALAVVMLTGCAEGRAARPAEISVPHGFRVDAVEKNLAAPTVVTFDTRTGCSPSRAITAAATLV